MLMHCPICQRCPDTGNKKPKIAPFFTNTKVTVNAGAAVAAGLILEPSPGLGNVLSVLDDLA